MSERRRTKRGFWIGTLVSLTVAAASLWGIYYFLFKYMSGRDATVIAVVVGVVGVAAIGLGIRSNARMTFGGADPDEESERILRWFFPQNPVFWFWVLAPLLFPLFATIYMLFLTLLALLIHYLLYKIAPGASLAIASALSTVVKVVSWAFALFSMWLLWREMRKQRREQLAKKADLAGESGGRATGDVET